MDWTLFPLRLGLTLWGGFFLYATVAGLRSNRVLIVHSYFFPTIARWFVDTDEYHEWMRTPHGRSMPWRGIFGGTFDRDLLEHDRLWWQIRALHAFLGLFTLYWLFETPDGDPHRTGWILIAIFAAAFGPWTIRKLVPSKRDSHLPDADPPHDT